MLFRSPGSISFREAIEAVDGPLTGDFCPFSPEHCDPSACIFGREVSRQAENLVEYLGRRTIADVVREGIPRFLAARKTRKAMETGSRSVSTPTSRADNRVRNIPTK